MHEHTLCASAGSLVDLSKDELKDKLQEASEVGNVMTTDQVMEVSTPACHRVTDGCSVLTGDRRVALWARGGTSLPWGQIWSSEDLTGEGKETHWHTVLDLMSHRSGCNQLLWWQVEIKTNRALAFSWWLKNCCSSHRPFSTKPRATLKSCCRKVRREPKIWRRWFSLDPGS